jgi:hypothetical protein
MNNMFERIHNFHEFIIIWFEKRFEIKSKIGHQFENYEKIVFNSFGLNSDD